MRSRALAIVLAVVVLAAVPAGAQSGQISDLQAKVDVQANRIAEARVRADAASALFLAAESELDGLEEQTSVLQAQVDEKQQQLDTLRTDLQSFAIDRYMAGGASESPSIFESSDVNEAMARGALADVVGGRKVDVIEEVRLIQADLMTQRDQLDAQKATLRAKSDELAANNDRLAKEVAALEGEYDKLNKLLEGLKEEERQRYLAQVRREQADRSSRRASERQSSRSGYVPSPPWTCPVPSGSSFIDSWGFPRSGGRRHKGVDMMARSGTPVVAPVSGTVTFRGNSIGGLSYHLNGDDGNYYYGTHLSRYGDQSGRVSAGTVIGYVGSTGNASTPHLHFEIHLGGQGNAVNPYPAVATYC